MKCETHAWSKRSLPCPWLACKSGTRQHWVEVGKTKKKYYVRVRNKDARGPVYSWKKLDGKPVEKAPNLDLDGWDQNQEIVW